MPFEPKPGHLGGSRSDGYRWLKSLWNEDMIFLQYHKSLKVVGKETQKESGSQTVLVDLSVGLPTRVKSGI